MTLLLVGAIVSTFVAIFLDQALRRHRLPHNDFITRWEMLDPGIYDVTGQRLLLPTMVAWVAVLALWSAFLMR
jgi:hypothetical protein